MKKIYLVSLVSLLCCTIQHSNAGTTGTTPADGSGNTYGYVQIGTQYLDDRKSENHQIFGRFSNY